MRSQSPVREPIAGGHGLLRRGQAIFIYLHLAVSLECTETLLVAKTTSIAYEMARLADALHRKSLQAMASNAYEVERACLDTDLVIGAILRPGGTAPRLVSNDLFASMKPGSVFVDISIDQGGCFEAARPISHSNPIHSAFGSTLYCVANMAGTVPHAEHLFSAPVRQTQDIEAKHPADLPGRPGPPGTVNA